MDEIEDGVPLFSEDHPTDGSVCEDLEEKDLNEESLESIEKDDCDGCCCSNNFQATPTMEKSERESDGEIKIELNKPQINKHMNFVYDCRKTFGMVTGQIMIDIDEDELDIEVDNSPLAKMLRSSLNATKETLCKELLGIDDIPKIIVEPKIKYRIDYDYDSDAWSYNLRFMTKEKADFVRELRCDRVDGCGYTWRSIARICGEEWGGDWSSSQIMGMALCESAAKYFGEDCMQEPWN